MPASAPTNADATETRHPPRATFGRWDVLVALTLAIAAGVATWFGSRAIEGDPPEFIRLNIWFEADCPRVVNDISTRRSVQERTATHPLHSLLIYPWVAGLRWTTALPPLLCVRIVRVGIAAACATLFYTLVRLVSGRRLDSIVFTALAGTSAAAMAWFIVPESWPPGLLSILAALCIVAEGQRRPLGPLWDVLANLLTLAFTITNGIVGIAATFARHPPRRALLLVAVSVCLLLGLMAVQQQVFPAAIPLPVPRHEGEYVLTPDAGGPLRVATVFFCHAVVMPAVQAVPRYGTDVPPILSVQRASLGSGGPLGAAATALWLALFACGLWELGTAEGHQKLRSVLLVAIASQLLLHLLYGPETFLYALHYGPLLVLAAAWSLQTRLASPARILALLLVATGGLNNVHQLRNAIALADRTPPAPSSAPDAAAKSGTDASAIGGRGILEGVSAVGAHGDPHLAVRRHILRAKPRCGRAGVAAGMRPALQKPRDTRRDPGMGVACERVRPSGCQLVRNEPQGINGPRPGTTGQTGIQLPAQGKPLRRRPAGRRLLPRRLPLRTHPLVTRQQYDDHVGPRADPRDAAQRRVRAA